MKATFSAERIVKNGESVVTAHVNVKADRWRFESAQPPTELFEVTVAEGGHTQQYYRWVTKAQRFPLKTVRKQGTWSEEFRRVIFTEQSPFLFELPRRLDNANPSADTQQ